MIDQKDLEGAKHIIEKMGANRFTFIPYFLGQEECSKYPLMCLAIISKYWEKNIYDAIPEEVKEDRDFKDEINKLKLKNGLTFNSGSFIPITKGKTTHD